MYQTELIKIPLLNTVFVYLFLFKQYWSWISNSFWFPTLVSDMKPGQIF